MCVLFLSTWEVEIWTYHCPLASNIKRVNLLAKEKTVALVFLHNRKKNSLRFYSGILKFDKFVANMGQALDDKGPCDYDTGHKIQY